MTPTNVPERSGSTVSEDSSGSSEDRVRKFQKTGEQGNRLRKTSASNAITAGRPLPPINHNPAGRGRAKVPLGPREPRQDFSKQSLASVEGRSFLPTPANETTTTTTTTTRLAPSNPRFSFSKQEQQHQQQLHHHHHQQQQQQHGQGQLESTKEELSESFGSYDFLPSVNFDDFANRLAYEPTLSDFPVPGNFTSDVPAGNGQVQMQPFTSNPVDPYPTRTSSFARRFSQSTVRKASGGSTASGSDTSSMPPPPSNMAIRTRRQSQFPAQAPPNPAARPPRKSVGPGMLPTNSFERDRANDNTMPRLTRAPSFSKGGRRETLSANLSTTTTGVPKLPTATRNAKAKSLQPPSRHQSGHLTVSSNAPDLNPMPNNTRSPGRSPGAQPSYGTPSSANKRQSAAPHISGLGARTISPTDARRLRRLSINPNHPPPGGPVGPPTPQADAAFDERAFSQSPAMVHGGNMTPSSARATPEQKRKSYASGVSLSSNSSLNSLKVGPSSIPLRVNPAPSGSRLPAPKPRNVQSSAGGEQEEVPPVPAIPKAYESPKEPERGSFTFTTAPSKMSTPQPVRQDAMATPEAQKPEARQSETSDGSFSNRSSGSIRHRRGLTVGNGPEQERTPTVQQSSKKSLQPIRLPPLNLLPLGTPFNNRISSFPTPSGDLEEGAVTPPPKRALNKTPSTPMTASKANFFSRHTSHDEYHKHLRSSSSAINLRQTDSSLDAHPNIGNLPIPTLNPTRQATTPFSSNSLPKGSGEFARLQSRPSGEYKSSLKDVEMQSMVAGPRPLQKTLTSDSVQTSTSTEPETPSSGSSLRRKLSISGWRRASSKAASHPAQTAQVRKPGPKAEEARPQQQQQQQQQQQPTKQSGMPPPRLPASATWSGAINSTPSPATSRTRPSLDFGRRKASTSAVASDTEVEKNSARKPAGNAGIRVVSGHVDASNNQPTQKSSSILTPMQRMLGTKSSSNMLKSRNLDSNLDRDDMLADEEMKKLASKRKDFEHAARDVDELRKRATAKERVSPSDAMRMANLNIFERGEIIDYKEVYFCGTKNAKKHVGDLNAQTANFGYDDERGDYNIVLGDHLAYRYEVVDLLGKGSFGQVVRCVDHKTGGLEAIKIIRNKKRFHQQALVEVNILQKLREWDPDNKHSMINFTQSFYFRGHLCISTELLGMNLYEFIKAHEFKGFSVRLIRRFCKQMLASLVLLKAQKVIHCDLKPENILLAHPLHSEIKVIDFGSSCFETEKVYTYIQSRFYRSPEVILGMSYGLPIDMWSLGCILAELLTGYPIFPGENEQEQLACIMEIFGPPEKHLIEKSSRKKLFFDSLGKPRVTVSSKGRRRRPSSKTLQQALKCDDEAFLDFVARCLRWDPERRMKPDEAMQHEFITGVRKTSQPRRPFNSSTGVSSPAKRMPAAPTSQPRVRPLPEPPATSFRNATAASGQREVATSNSPVKGSAPQRRHSNVQGNLVGTKRAANGAPLNTASGSGLPRVAQRSVSGKPDLASAAAIASLVSREHLY
ncbi:SPS1 [Pyrenophora teres f. teres]|uniref:dual-specificity kinase n=1 Tax=Pyrenophora teres f. teres TaxID=97479 RepID=A0A6S6W2L1_9PLEO|nr:SPS1 [Pyrenophora teres f. teres]